MHITDTVLYDQFIAARLEAVELTDLYRDTASDDPRRTSLWDRVVRQTETARALLESWLQAGQVAEPLQPRARSLKRTANPASAGR